MTGAESAAEITCPSYVGRLPRRRSQETPNATASAATTKASTRARSRRMERRVQREGAILPYRSSRAKRDCSPNRATRSARRAPRKRCGSDPSAARLDALDALQATRQQAATRGAAAAVFDEVGPFQRQLARAGVERDLRLCLRRRPRCRRRARRARASLSGSRSACCLCPCRARADPRPRTSGDARAVVTTTMRSRAESSTSAGASTRASCSTLINCLPAFLFASNASKRVTKP